MIEDQFNHEPLPDWIKRQLAELRKQLEGKESWPSTAAQLLQELTESDQPTAARDEDMLSLVVNDALQGIDIISQYPAFYRRLQADAELRQAFLDALDLLESSAADELIAPPQMPAPDFSFLKTAVSPDPVIKQTSAYKWRATWQLLQSQLQLLLKPVDLVYRSDNMDLEDESTVLLRSQVQMDGTQIDLSLEAIRKVEEPNHLYLYLAIAPLTDKQLPAMQANLQWGEFQETAVTDKYGRFRFNPLPLTAVLDPTSQTFRADLQLTVEVGTKP